MLGPHRITSRSREASASPSVSLEKGKYRMRAPSQHSLPVKNTASQSSAPHYPPRSSSRNNVFFTVLLLLLATGCVASFGIAYYLFSTRWGSPHLPSRSCGTDEQPQPQAIEIEAPQTTCPSVLRGEKFLVYHTHSGFHNQRIALENAITLSHLLNRTLIVSPIRLGKPIRYCNFYALHNYLQLSDKVGLEHCARLSPDSFVPPECSDHFDYTHLPWSWLVDFASIQSRHRVIIRGNHTDQWIYGCLGIAESDVLTLKELSRYQYRFSDGSKVVIGSSDKYSEIVSIPQLRAAHESLLHLGTLFGTSRLLLEDEKNALIRRRIRENMTFRNPLLIEIPRTIEEHLGGHFIGIHVRLGDGDFLKSVEENIHSIWSTLVHRIFHLTVNDTLALEDLQPLYSSPAISAPHTVNVNAVPRSNGPRLRCHSQLHTVPRLNPLNIPLYLATDARQPRDHPLLTIFFKTFPCAFTLADMTDQLAPLDDLMNGVDDLKLKPFLLPFVDAMVLGRAWNVVGTTSSTFSAFVLEVLWPTFHGFGITERD